MFSITGPWGCVICVCTYVCMCTRMHVYMYMCVHVFMCAHVCTCMCTLCVRAWVHVYLPLEGNGPSIRALKDLWSRGTWPRHLKRLLCLGLCISVRKCRSVGLHWSKTFLKNKKKFMFSVLDTKLWRIVDVVLDFVLMFIKKCGLYVY